MAQITRKPNHQLDSNATFGPPEVQISVWPIQTAVLFEILRHIKHESAVTVWTLMATNPDRCRLYVLGPPHPGQRLGDPASSPSERSFTAPSQIS